MRRHSDARSDSGGFALVAVLACVAALTLLAVWFAARQTADTALLAVQAHTIRAELAAEAGLTRTLAALADASDPLALSLVNGGGHGSWHFDDAEIDLWVRPESSKIDILAGPSSLMDALIAAKLGDTSAAKELLERLRSLQSRPHPPEVLRAFLPADARIGPLLHRFDDSFTIYSGLHGVDPLTASPDVLDAISRRYPALKEPLDESLRNRRVSPALASGLGTMLSSPRPLFTVTVHAKLQNGMSASLEALVQFAASHRPASVLRKAWLGAFDNGAPPPR